MAAIDLSVVVSALDEEAVLGSTLETISGYFRSSGLSYEILVAGDLTTGHAPGLAERLTSGDPAIRFVRRPESPGKGSSLRRAAAEARGEVIAFVDGDLPYEIHNLGEAVALVQSDTTDIAIGAPDLRGSDRVPSGSGIHRLSDWSFSLLARMLLAPRIPYTQCGLKAFSGDVAKFLFSESKINGPGLDCELLFLANRYGFRVERVRVTLAGRPSSKSRPLHGPVRMAADIFRIRRFDRRMMYRPVRRCPVCFSSSVFSLTQVDARVVRACRRCKCRYLAVFPAEDEIEKLHEKGAFCRDPDQTDAVPSVEADAARSRTDNRRLSILRRIVPYRARLLEVGCGGGRFGSLVARDYEYVGIDLSAAGVGEARARGLEVYRASLSRFVNTGAPFDAITLFHVFEHLADPHDALGRLEELLKPGGTLVLVTPDTESLFCAISGDRWVNYRFPEHLILYSRSALIELLEHSGFEILSIGPDFEYTDRTSLLTRLKRVSPMLALVTKPALAILPNPMPVSSGSIRVIAKRRAGPPVSTRAIRVIEPTHAR